MENGIFSWIVQVLKFILKTSSVYGRPLAQTCMLIKHFRDHLQGNITLWLLKVVRSVPVIQALLSWWIDSLNFNKADNERSSTVVHDFNGHNIKGIYGIYGNLPLWPKLKAMLGCQ